MHHELFYRPCSIFPHRCFRCGKRFWMRPYVKALVKESWDNAPKMFYFCDECIKREEKHGR